MSDNESAVVMTIRQAAELDHSLERNGWKPEDVKKLSSGDTLAQVLRVIRGEAEIKEIARVASTVPPIAVAHTGTLTVDYSQTLEQMIAAGHYDWKGGGITAEHFQIVGTGTVELEFKVFDFGHDISSENAIESITVEDKANPWAPAKMEHVLAYGAQFPKEQRKKPIVGLGSVAGGSGCRFVPCLCKSGSGWGLDLSWWVGDWSALYRFLAVRPVTRASVA